jgi:2-phosphosulfolactate phosphatase
MTTSLCEWGVHAVQALAERVDVVVVVDVLSFSTAVQVAVSRGATVFPSRWKDESALALANSRQAMLAGPRSHTQVSLSPTSLLRLQSGARIVLPSPNGATVSLAAGEKPVLAGCLRNAAAVARAALQLGARIAVIPAGERWPDGQLRPALEDWLGAGAILAHLPGRSAEAQAAVDAFEAARDRLLPTLLAIPSGRELIERGFEQDVHLAAQLNVSDCTPRLLDGAYVSWSTSSPHRSAQRVTERHAVRGLVIANGQVLLMQMAFPWLDAPIWITPGGGIDAGEEPVAALRRELAEELGRDDLEVGAELWRRTLDIPRTDGVLRQQERYFVVRAPHFEPRPSCLTADEHSWLRSFRWWSPQELAAEPSVENGRQLAALLTSRGNESD